MKNLLTIVFVFTLLAACSDAKQGLVSAIEKAEANLSKTVLNADKAKADAAIQAYTAYTGQYPADAASPAYLFKAAQLSEEVGNFKQAADLYQQLLDKHPADANAERSLYNWAILTEAELKDAAKAKELYDRFVKEFPKSKLATKVKFLSDNINKSEADIEAFVGSAESALFGDTAKVEFDRQSASKTVDAYEKFATKFPKHKNTPVYLFKAAEIYRSLRDFPKAIEAYQTIYTQHPDYEKAPHSLFLLGFSYENDLKQNDKAREVYELFLKNYKDHELADDVQFSLSNLGKSPEEIIKQFEKNKGKTPDKTPAEANKDKQS